MRKKRVFFWALGIIGGFFLGFTLWAVIIPAPMPDAINALDDTATVNTEYNGAWVFHPRGVTPTKGFIIYPGGRVDPRSYAPAARAIAENGYLVIIMPMVLNLAIFSPDRAQEAIDAFPAIQAWVIGGHSLGGVMAAQFASARPDTVGGIIFWASYPAASMATSPAKFLSISGSLDGLSTPEKVESSRRDLPAHTEWVQIEGGNHAQFGYYGDQPGDNPATITREAQQQIIVAACVDFLTQM